MTPLVARVGCAILLGLGLAPLAAEVHGPDAQVCKSGMGSAVLVRVTGFRSHDGTVRVRLFGGDPATYFDGKYALVRTQIPTPPVDTVDICISAPGPGTYAIDVRHDVNGNDATDRGDGGGISGNPSMSMWDVILRRRPSPAVTRIIVSQGVKIVPVRLRYF